MRAGHDANYESVEDSAKDLINYSSFLVSFLRRKIPGQDPSKDMFGNKIMDTGAKKPGIQQPTFLVDHAAISFEFDDVASVTRPYNPAKVMEAEDLHNIFTKDP
jgi:hypothetical protein